MWRFFTNLFHTISATNSLEAQLFPPLRLPVKFRPYVPADFDECVAIYQKNEPGRFPEGQIATFKKYLNREQKALIIAELDSKVVGYGGLKLHPPRAAVLCYGIVDPSFQGRRIGTTLTLLRMSLLPPYPGDLVVLIFAVDASMPFYEGFGFSKIGNWTVDQNRQFPAGALRVSRQTLSYIRQTLQKRGIKVEGNLVLEASESKSFEVQESPNGLINVKLLKQEGAGQPTDQQNP